MKSNAYKCKRCGKFFEEDQKPKITFLYTEKGMAYPEIPQLVLCQSCTDKLLKFVNSSSVEVIEKEFTDGQEKN